MKTLILTITATGVVAGLCFYAKPCTTKALSTDTVIPFEEQTAGNPTAKVPKGVIPANTPGAPTQTSHSISTTPAAPRFSLTTPSCKRNWLLNLR